MHILSHVRWRCRHHRDPKRWDVVDTEVTAVTHLSIHPSNHIHLSICLPFHYIHLSYPSIYLFINLSTCLCIHISIYCIHLSIYPSIYLSYPSIYHIHPSIISTHLSYPSHPPIYHIHHIHQSIISIISTHLSYPPYPPIYLHVSLLLCYAFQGGRQEDPLRVWSGVPSA